MRKLLGICFCCMFAVLPVAGQEAISDLTPQELAVIENIKAQNRTPEEITQATSTPPAPPESPMQAPPHAVSPDAADHDIQLSEQAKQQAWDEQKQLQDQEQADLQATLQAAEETVPVAAGASALPKEGPAETEQEETADASASGKCLTVAFIDIDIAFNEHPRTQAVKKQIDTKIKSKQREVQNARDIIAALEAENQLLSRQLAQLKPFYERIVTDQQLLPKVPESADSLALGNTLNRLLFSGCEVLSTTPMDTPSRLDDITERIGANKKIIADRSFFIDNYKYQTREEILKLEQEEVKAILQDIYAEIKTFAKKRNIGAIVRKDEILYGQQSVNVTKDFVDRLKKSKKYRKKK